MTKRMKLGLLGAVVTLMIVLAVPENASAAEVFACKNIKSGSLRIVAADTTCAPSETKISWNEATTTDVICGTLYSTITDAHLRKVTCYGNLGLAKFVFLTDSTYTGNLGGITSSNPVYSTADKKCKDEAGAAGLPGTYKAWISNYILGAISPSLRFTKGVVPYVRTDFTRIATSWATFASATHENPIDTDANGDAIAGPLFAWTGTDSDGTSADPVACAGWITDQAAATGVIGEPDQTDATWTNFSSAGCNNTHRLICVQQ